MDPMTAPPLDDPSTRDIVTCGNDANNPAAGEDRRKYARPMTSGAPTDAPIVFLKVVNNAFTAQ